MCENELAALNKYCELIQLVDWHRMALRALFNVSTELLELLDPLDDWSQQGLFLVVLAQVVQLDLVLVVALYDLPLLQQLQSTLDSVGGQAFIWEHNGESEGTV